MDGLDLTLRESESHEGQGRFRMVAAAFIVVLIMGIAATLVPRGGL